MRAARLPPCITGVMAVVGNRRRHWWQEGTSGTGMITAGLLLLAGGGAAAAAAAAPVVFWNSEGQLSNTTVLALGSALTGATVTVCHDPAHTADCGAAEVLQSSSASIHFVLPAATGRATGAKAAKAAWFRACTTPSACSAWRPVNSPDVWWAQGDQSRNATAVAAANGWLRVYGRALGFNGGGHCTPGNTSDAGPASRGATTAVLTPAAGGPGTPLLVLTLPATTASCYDAAFKIPAGAAAGAYTLTIGNGLSPAAVTTVSHDLQRLAVTIVPAAPWPVKRFAVATVAQPIRPPLKRRCSPVHSTCVSSL